MATQRFTGNAAAVAQVQTFTVTADDATTTYSVTINGKVVSVLGTGSGVNSTAAAIQAALAAAASNYAFPEFAEVVWTVATATITATAATAGVPFAFTKGVAGGTGTLSSITTVTASSGPNDWSTAANWSTGSVPVDGDDTIADVPGTNIYFGLAQGGVTLNSLTIPASFNGQIGLPDINNTGNYYEYRTLALAIGLQGAFVVSIGNGLGGGSGFIRLNLSDTKAFVTVYSTGSPTLQNVEALQIANTAANSTLAVYQGSVGLAVTPGDTATFSSISTGYLNSPAGDVALRGGPGLSLTTLDMAGGNVTINNTSIATVLMSTGTLTMLGSSAVSTQLTCEAGTVYWCTSGACAAATFHTGTLDCSRDLQAHTFSATIQLYAGAGFLDPFKTIGAAVKLNGCSVIDLSQFDWGKDETLTRS